MKSRRSIRLREYDYSQNGLYFITICVDGREELLGNVENGKMVLNDAGKIVDMCIHTIPEKYENIDIDSYIIMPNHIHIVIAIVGAIHELPENNELPKKEKAIHESPLQQNALERRKMLLPKIVGYLKMNSSKQINILRGKSGVPLWQRNYHEHIIRNEKELDKIRHYININPAKWEMDRYNKICEGEEK
ncbi:MAG TPA: transposase [bacterium]|nr:transposase [bacterium]